MSKNRSVKSSSQQFGLNTDPVYTVKLGYNDYNEQNLIFNENLI